MTVDSAAIERLIHERRTLKVFADQPLDVTTDRAAVEALLACAGAAPFHKPAAEAHRDRRSALMPWRAYVLDVAACRRWRATLLADGDDSRIPAMLAAATALIQVTWLPDPPAESAPVPFEPTIANMEHIAAASAAIQNILLAATARGIPNYWSSGGLLRTRPAMQAMGIPAPEILLAAVFLFPAEHPTATTAPGKLHDQRGPIGDWVTWIPGGTT